MLHQYRCPHRARGTPETGSRQTSSPEPFTLWLHSEDPKLFLTTGSGKKAGVLRGAGTEDCFSWAHKHHRGIWIRIHIKHRFIYPLLQMTEFLPFLPTFTVQRSSPCRQQAMGYTHIRVEATAPCPGAAQLTPSAKLSCKAVPEHEPSLCQSSCANQTSPRSALLSARLPNRSRGEHVLTLDPGNVSKENSCQRLHCERTLCAKGVPRPTRSWKAG